jgi:hypothetical protein
VLPLALSARSAVAALLVGSNHIQRVSLSCAPPALDAGPPFCLDPSPGLLCSSIPCSSFLCQDDWDRMGVFESFGGRPSPYAICELNDGYELCPTYPRKFVVPRLMDDLHIRATAAFRSKKRLPVLSWVSKTTRAGLWRAAQPKVGVTGFPRVTALSPLSRARLFIIPFP